MVRIALFIAVLASVLEAKITLEQINDKPPSRAKNFLIWRFMHQKITPQEAQKAFYQIDGVTINDLYLYARKGDEKEIRYVTRCLSIKPKKMLGMRDEACLNLALRPSRYLKLTPKERKALLKKVKDKRKRSWMKAMQGHQIANAVTAENLLYIFATAGSKYRIKNFNRPYCAKEMHNLTGKPHFDTFIKQCAIDSRLEKTKKSLLHVKPSQKLSPQSNFLLALNALRQNKRKQALEHLQLAEKSYYYRAQKDKALFWRYLITKKREILQKLAKSFDINIYTLYAREKLGLPLGNYYSDLHVSKRRSGMDISDPFAWHAILGEIKERKKPAELEPLLEKYDYKDMLCVKSFIYERYTEYEKQGFLLPYEEELKGVESDTKALVYAIMRQESRFIPAALSNAYAMGLMQMMPFLAKAMQKKLRKKLSSLDDMFNPAINIAFALEHIKWLRRSFYHPLFLAYAYNGGYGFAKKHIMQQWYMKTGAYEPFMSMELMLNSESREYAKRVLANYVVYKKILGESVSILTLFDTLKQPSRTDRFRAAK